MLRTAALLAATSTLAIATPALSSSGANSVVFGDEAQVTADTRVGPTTGLVQVRLAGGAMASFTEGAQFTLRSDGSVDLHEGSVTLSGEEGQSATVRMPDGTVGQLGEEGSSGTFVVTTDGSMRGHAMSGSITVDSGENTRNFRTGEMWRARSGASAQRTVSNGAIAQPRGARAGRGRTSPTPPVVALGGDAGPVAAAQNGIPVTLGGGLAAAGASSDILGAARSVEAAVANPALETFPSGDLALLVGSAAGLENAFGGTPFPQAQADIIRAYLGFLAQGGSGEEFVTSYALFLTQFLDLVRSGAAPSSFDVASVADINAFLAFQDRRGALGNLTARDAVLADAFLAFIRDGGSADLFAGSFTDLTEAYFAFIRAGGDPADFTGASQATLTEFIAFLDNSGLSAQLSAADQALLSAFIANGGLAFTTGFRAELDAFSAFIASGNLPSQFTASDSATIRARLETLEATGLLATVTGEQAAFFANYLVFLQSGGAPDAFAGLPANIFAGYATDLNAYFTFLNSGGRPSAFAGTDIAVLQGYLAELEAAGALDRFLANDRAQFFDDYLTFLQTGGGVDEFGGLNLNIFAGYADALTAYRAFLEAGGRPSDYAEADVTVLNQLLAELATAGALDTFLGLDAGFFDDYLAFLRDGGEVDAFAQLNANIFAGYAEALAAYFQFLTDGGLPSAYQPLTQAEIASFVEALEAVGATNVFLADLADFYAEYFAFVQNGGNPDNFANLPVPPDFPAFAVRLNAFAAFLNGGGLPSGFTDADITALSSELRAVINSGQLDDLLGDNAALLSSYFAFLSGGGTLDGFSGLPIYIEYVTALNAYSAFLADGGLPADYDAVDQATLNAFLAALNDAGGLAAFASLDGFFGEYFAFVATGGDPATFGGLPIYAEYVAALNAYFAFLADGGLPSDYTVLDQATLDAYLAALSGTTGGLADFAALNAFFADFFAFLQGGGDADQFAGLPANMDMGGGDPDAASPQLAGLTSIVFDDSTLRTNSGSSADISADGRITAVTITENRTNPITFDYTGRDGDLREFGRIGDDVAWTRYFEGRSGQLSSFSTNLLVGAPATNLPQSGRVDFKLVGGTAPTNARAESETQAYFTGNLALAYGSVARLGLDFRVLSGTEGYEVRTGGGAADPTVGGFVIGSGGNGRFEAQALGLQPLTDTSCTGFCQAQLFGGLFGDGGTSAGFTYNLFDRNAGQSLQGVAVFASEGEALAGLGTAPGSGGGTGNVGPVITTRANEFATGFYDGADIVRGLSTATLEDGVLAAFSTGAGPVEPTTADVVEGGSNDDMSWGRWTGGQVTVTNFFGVNAMNGRSFHAFSGSSPTNLPASGVVEYELIGSTSPTDNQGSAPGTITGDMAVSFAGARHIGLELTMEVGGKSWSTATTGGVADPTQSEITYSFPQNPFELAAPNVTSSDNACVTSCAVNLSGRLFGDRAQSAAVAMLVNDQSNGMSTLAQGIALFGATGTDAVGSGAGGISASGAPAVGGVSTAPIGNPAPPPPPPAPTTTNWARWDVLMTASSAARPVTREIAIAPGLTAERSTTLRNLSEARRIAERALGGLVTFEQ